MSCNIQLVDLHLWYALIHVMALMLSELQVAPVFVLGFCDSSCSLGLLHVDCLLNSYSAISSGAQTFMLYVLQCNDSFTEQVSPVTSQYS